MNEQQAIALVQKTFKSAFDRQGYIHFLKNLLNEFDEEGARSNQGSLIPDKFRNYVDKLERVGKYRVDNHEIMLFIVYLKNETSLERTRTMQRSFVAHYLQMDMKDAALVAFVSKNPADWRFSFIKMEYRCDEEKNKIKEEFTPAKRWSFLVGANEASHTAQRKLVPLMADDEHNPTLAELEEAFNIEKVTKEFFEKYRGLFIRTKEELDKVIEKDAKVRADFERNGIDTVNFAKKLLGQIIFLYYLQKKGWFGVARDTAWGDGSQNFLRELFDKKHGDYKNFFNDILEPLFYDALRRDRSEDNHYYPKFDCKIPFLNGGLFDPMNHYDWIKTDILLPNELFSNASRVAEGVSRLHSARSGFEKIPPQSPLCQRGEGDGILDIFDRYNFTVKEDEPFEKEVAIDPELLGKAYEKFNAIRPDNYDEFLQALKSGKKGDESKFNKQYGVYYTPREIVHYMCQQSLINYLYSEVAGVRDVPSKDDFATLILKGEQIKEHDERVVAEGCETKNYPFQMPKSIRIHAALIDEKLANIKVCDPAVGSGAFPVGMMSEIVRARTVLDLYMRPDRFSKPVRSVYAFKRGCIENSLYGVDIDSGAVEIAKLRLWLSLIVDEDDIENIKPLPNLDYKIVCGNSLVGFQFKSKKLDEIEMLKSQYFDETRYAEKLRLKTQIDQETKKAFETSERSLGYAVNFDFEFSFSEVFRVNGGFDVVIGNPPYIQIQKFSGQAIQTAWQNQKYETFVKIGDIYALFIEKGVSLLNSNGLLTFITSNKWMRAGYGKALREFLANKTHPSKLIDFSGYQVFESATVDSNILITQKQKTDFNACTIQNDFTLETNLTNYFAAHSQKMPMMSGDAWVISSNIEQRIKTKIEAKGTPLKDWDVSIYRGIITGFNEAFIIDTLTKERLCLEDTKSVEIIKPVLRGRDIKRYAAEWADLWLINSHNNPPVNIHNYPAIKKHLDNFYPQLEKRQDKGITPYNLRNCAYLKEFEKEKIVYSEIVREPQFHFDTNNFCAEATSFLLTGANIKYLVSLLNSKFVTWAFKSFYAGGGLGESGYRYKKAFLKLLPIPKLSEPEQQPFIELVDKISIAKKAGQDTSEWEKEIDELVYALYGLTQEEIDIVESKP